MINPVPVDGKRQDWPRLVANAINALLAREKNNGVTSSRRIDTSAPLTGGGDLTADRTLAISAATTSAAGSMSAADKTKLDGVATGATANTGTVTSVSVVTSAGVSGSVATATTTPAITFTLGAITPTSVAATGTVSGTNITTGGNVTGNAATATTLATARTIGISGAVTGTATSFNGGANITIPVTALNMSLATAGTLAIARGGTGRTTAVPMLTVFRYGTSSFISIGAAFTTIPLNTVTIDTASAYNTTTGIYTLPETGTYLITAKMRFVDTPGAGFSYGIGMDTSNADGPSFFWSVTTAAPGSGAARQGIANSRFFQGTAGDQIRLFAYVDGALLGVSGAELNVIRIR